jgi:hypothetical protein
MQLTRQRTWLREEEAARREEKGGGEGMPGTRKI